MAVNESLVLSVRADMSKATQQMQNMLAEMRALSSAAKTAKQDMDSIGKGGKGSSPFGAQLNDMKKLAPMMSRYATDMERAAKASGTIKSPKTVSAGGGTSDEAKKAEKSVNGMNKSLIKTAALWGGALYAAKQFGDALSSGIQFNAMLESANVAFEVMLGNADSAKKLMGELKALSMYTPIGLEESAKSAKQLVAYGFKANTLVDTMKMLGTVTAATGGGLDDLSYVYGTLRTQGRAYTRDLMQFAMRGIPIYENLAAVLGVNVSQIKKMTEEGKIGFPEVEAAFKRMTSQGGVYFGMLERSMETLTGKANLMGKTFTMAMGDLSKPLETPLKGIVDVITDFLRKNGDAFSDIGQLLAQGLASAADLLPSLLDCLLQITKLIVTIGANLVVTLEPVLEVVTAILSTLARASAFVASQGPAGKLNNRDALIRSGVSSGNANEKMASLASGMIDKNMTLLFGQFGDSIGKWFAANMQKDQMTFSGAQAYAKQFGVSVKDIADSALEAGYISKQKWQLFIDSIPTPKSVETKMSDVGYANTLANMAGSGSLGAKQAKSGQLAMDFNWVNKWYGSVNKWAEALGLNMDKMDDTVAYLNTIASSNATPTNKAAALSNMPSDLRKIYDAYYQGFEQLRSTWFTENEKGIQAVLTEMNGMAARLPGKKEEIDAKVTEVYGDALSDAINNYVAKLQVMLAEMHAKGDEVSEKQIEDKIAYYKELLSKKGKKPEELDWDKWFPKELVVQATRNPVDDIVLENAKMQEQVIIKYKEWLKATATSADSAEAIARLAQDNANASIIYQHKLDDAYNSASDAMNSVKWVRGSFTDSIEQLNDATTKQFKSVKDSFNIARAVLVEKLLTGQISGDTFKQAIDGLVDDLNKANKSIEEQINKKRQALKAAQFDTKFSTKDRTEALKASMVTDTGDLVGNAEMANIKGAVDAIVAGGSTIAESLNFIGTNLKPIMESIGKQAEMALTDATSGTEVGNIAVGAAAGPMGALLAVVNEAVKAFMDFMGGLEGFNDLLNPIKTVLGSMASGVGKLLMSVLEPIEEILRPIVELLGPLIAILGAVTKVGNLFFTLIVKMLVPVIKILADVFGWLYNKIFVPVGNLIIGLFNTVIRTMNGFIAMINKALGWLGVHISSISEISYLPIIDFSESSEDAAAAAKRLENQFNKLSATLEDVLSATLDYLNDKLRSVADKTVTTLKDLYEAGAITAAQYDAQSKEAMKYVQALEESMVLDSAKNLTDPKAIYEEILKLMNVQEQVQAIKDSGATIAEKINQTNEILTSLGSFGGGLTSVPKSGTTGTAGTGTTDTGTAPSNTPPKLPLTKSQLNALETQAHNLRQSLYRSESERLHLTKQQKDDIYAEYLEIVKQLQDAGISGYITNFTYAVGTSNINKDQLAMVHKGEGIIPKSFNDAIKNGDYTLSGGMGTSGGGNVIVNVTVNGSVQAERDLASSIATEIFKQRKRGMLTV